MRGETEGGKEREREREREREKRERERRERDRRWGSKRHDSIVSLFPFDSSPLIMHKCPK